MSIITMSAGVGAGGSGGGAGGSDLLAYTTTDAEHTWSGNFTSELIADLTTTVEGDGVSDVEVTIGGHGVEVVNVPALTTARLYVVIYEQDGPALAQFTTTLANPTAGTLTLQFPLGLVGVIPAFVGTKVLEVYAAVDTDTEKTWLAGGTFLSSVIARSLALPA